MRKRLLLIVPSVLLGTMAYYFLATGDDDSITARTDEGQSTISAAPRETQVGDELPPSGLADTTVKAFSLHYGLKSEFDLFIFEQDTDSLNALVEAYTKQVAERQFTADSQHYLIALFTRYVQYKADLETLDSHSESRDINAIANRLEARDDLRHTFFSEDEYHYLFSKDVQYDDAALARLRIASDATLSDEEKQRLIEAQLATLPADQQASFAPSIAVNRISALAKTYDNPETRYHAIAAEFGHEVAQRMREKAQAQETWVTRVNAFQQWQESVRASGLSPEEIREKIASRRSRDFTETEQRRLQVFLENPALLGSE